jgi:hypothetical protein
MGAYVGIVLADLPVSETNWSESDQTIQKGIPTPSLELEIWRIA